MIVDAHQHFWHPARGDYGWIPEGDPVFDRPYAPGDLAPHLETFGIDRTILVQAAPSVEETEYLLGIADATPFVAGVVGWIDFEDPGEIATLRRLGAHPKCLGMRPMIQDLPDPDWMHRPDIQWAFEALIDLDLTFDCLGFPIHLDRFHALLTRYPELRAVVDHGMKPEIRAHQNFADAGAWADGLVRIAEDTRACCKLSGLVTEATDWSTERIAPYAHHIIDAFGPERVMWGSDWPVLRSNGSYRRWRETSLAITASLDEVAEAAIFGGTAMRFYGLEE